MKKIIPILLGVFISSATIAQVELFNPINSPTGTGLAAQNFDAVNSIYDCMAADDFVVPAGETWYIDSLYLGGQYSAGAATTSGAIIHIYTDNSGEIGALVFSDTFTTNIDFDGAGDLMARWNEPVMLTSGHYWLAVQARKDFSNGGGQWYWSWDSSPTGYQPKWQNPNDGFLSGCTSWIQVQNCTALTVVEQGFLFTIYGCYGPNKPLHVFESDTMFCAGDSVFLMPDTLGSQTNVVYNWSNNASTMSIFASQGGNYQVLAVDTVTQCGMHNRFDVDMINLPQPNIFASKDTACANENPAQFSVLPANCSNCQGTWNDGSHGNTFSYLQTGWVFYTLTDTVNGCTATDSAYLVVDPSVVTILPGDPIDLCRGEKVELSTAEPLSNYIWAKSSNGASWTLIGTDTTAMLNTPGFARVEAETDWGCTAYDTVTVIDRPLPVPSIDMTMLPGGDVKLTATDGFSAYEWSNGKTTRSITVSTNGIYHVSVTDEFGCVGSQTYSVSTVGIHIIEDELFRAFPNPARDQIQIVIPSTWTGITQIEIFDLGGRLVKSSQIIENTATINISDLALGNYVLKYTASATNGQVSLVISK